MALSDVTLNSPFDLQSKPKEKLMESLVFDPWLKFNSSAWWPAAGPLKVKYC